MRLAFLMLVAVLAISCTSEKRTTYQVKGVIKEITPDRKQAQIEHEKIPGYMEAMTMMFDVKDPKELKGLQANDQVTFRMVVTEKDGWIEQVKKIGTVKPPAMAAAAGEDAPAPPPFRVVREVEPLKVGDLMPEYKFTNEVGKAMSLSEFRGKALAITFLFTRCPYPTFCPRMASNLKKACKLLSEKSDAPKNWHLLAITIDPGFDTPAVLKEYGTRYEYDPAKWNFLTGAEIDITAIAEQFGLMYWRPDPKQLAGISHNLRTVVIDANGRVQKILPENKWEPPELAEELIKAARVPPATAAAAGSGE
ncbi:MAG TPA: SCO family protein [Candidatus Binatia bacterium]|nr:SCO family protein [Candidatus Binatia bacterium]